MNGAVGNTISDNMVSLNVVIDLREEWNVCPLPLNTWSGHGAMATRDPSCLG